MKKIIFTLLIGALFTAVGCKKEKLVQSVQAPTSVNGLIDNVDYGNGNAKLSDPVNEWGGMVSTTEATARIAEWATQTSNMHTNGRLSSANYDDIRAVEGAKGLGITYSDSCGLIAFAMDEDNEPMMNLVFKLDDDGGFEMDTTETFAALDSDINADTTYLGTNTIGFDLSDSLIELEGAVGLTVHNALDDLGDDEYSLDHIFKPYDEEGNDFGTGGGTTGAKDCRKWVPASIHGSPTPIWHAGYWRDCTWAETLTWPMYNF